MTTIRFGNIFFAMICSVFFSCKQNQEPFVAHTVYEDEILEITQIAQHTFIHTSYKQTQDFGNVPCNGVIMRNNNEVVIFDTPTDTVGARILINWISETLKCSIVAVVPTHFHDDCLGGLATFHQAGIQSVSYVLTPHLADSLQLLAPQTTFQQSTTFTLGDEQIEVRYFGKGHTADNVVGYFPKDSVLFGGCLIKEVEASKGYLGDAYIHDWSATVQRVKETYPDVKIVVPGHGAYGDTALLNYTIQLFSSHAQTTTPEK